MPSPGGDASVALLTAGKVRVLASLGENFGEVSVGQSVRLGALPDPPILRAEPL